MSIKRSQEFLVYITLNFLFVFGMKFDTREELLELGSNKFYLNQIEV